MTDQFHVKELYRVCTEITEYLDENKYIGVFEYQNLLSLVGSGMASRLRLTPDSDLAVRLSHLYAVCKCAAMVEPIFENQVLISIEGLNPLFLFDCDLIIEDLGITYLIDFTSTGDAELLAEKKRVLESKIKDPSIQNRVVETIVYRFVPERFHVRIEYLCRSPKLENPETFTLNILETMARKSYTTNDKFIDNCRKVKDYASMRIRETNFKHTNYGSQKLSSEKLTIASAAAQSNVVSDICNLFLNISKKQYNPFIDTLKTLTAQFHSPKEPFIHRIADYSNNERSLEELLQRLSDDPLANLLKNACFASGRVANLKNDFSIEITDVFKTSRNNKRILASDSGYLASASRLKGHYFKIIFSVDFMDDQQKRVLIDFHKPSLRVNSEARASIDECIAKIKEAERYHHKVTRLISKRSPIKPHSTIFNKVITLSQKAKEDTGNIGLLSSNLLSSISSSINNTVAGALISNLYEITKSFSFSIKNSHKDETYYVGMNGPYDSITITKMSATQDSFDRLHYCVISKCTANSDYEEICWKKHHKVKNTSRSHFRTMDTNEVAYNLRVPYYILSLVTWDVETSLDKGRYLTSSLPEQISNSIVHTLVNRDTFSQAAQQVRYLYMSSIGYGADASKIVDKITFFKPKHYWEFIYLVRMVKLGFSLSVLRDNDSLSLITESGNLRVVFPHTSRVAQSFSEVVSSMYYCNIFNKFRSYHEISEAFCYNELIEELRIYNESRKNAPDCLAGFSYKTMAESDNVEYLVSDDFTRNECNYIDSLLEAGAGRFRSSCAVVIACSKQFVKPNESHIKQIYKELGKSPIEACTLRGSMEKGEATDKRQGCRAASAILEELMRQYDVDSDKLNNNSWLHSVFMNKIENSGGDASIFSLVANQLADDSIEYIYRIVDKDQIGNREISVLNAVFRIGALFVETISKTLANLIGHVNLLENSDKDFQFEKAVKTSVEDCKKSGDVLCSDNSDQKRWGPNHMLNVFCSMFYGILSRERGLLRMIYFVADKVLQKQAKFPESLIELFKKMNDSKNSSRHINRDGFNGEHGSDTLKKFFSDNANDLHNNKFSKTLPYGMCQGIFQGTSSLYHGIMCLFVQECASTVFGKSVNMKTFCTSDDASRLIVISRDRGRVQTVKQIHGIIILAGNLFNILRNDAKSAFSFYISEFNSIFFKNGILATPSLKQRISKIDIGSGSNHVEDYMTAISSAANYFSIGGSYVGACILSILNITLHTEQWSRWDRVRDNRYYLPVELDGFPVIEPLTTCLSGAVSNNYLRSAHLVSSKEYAAIFSSIVSEKPEEFKLSDYFRIPKNISEDSDSIKIFKNSGALGLHSLNRTDKKLSQFEKRHSMSKWIFPDHFLTLRKDSSDSKFFLYNIYKNGCMSLFQQGLGVNSFYKRFTDPWVSSDRKCVRVSKSSVLLTLGLKSDIKYSYNEISEALKQITTENCKGILKDMNKNVEITQFTENLIDQIIPRFNDSKQILDFINSQECSEYLEPKDTPATSRVTLRNHEALDKEKYTADLIKVLSGEKSRLLITQLYGDHRKFDTLPISKDCPNMELKDAILVAENSIHAFNKYIKRNTKMITAGSPSTLSDLVVKVLRSRFFEGLGIRLTGSIKLIGDRSHAFSYTSWYRELNNKSKDYANEIINQSCRQLYSDVVKYGLISDNKILTPKDHFEVADIPLDSKHMRIEAKSRSSLIAFAKSWVSANLTFSFSYDSLISFFRGQLLSRQGYRVSETRFVRPALGMYFDLTANGLPVHHLIETETKGDKNIYKHFFICESSSTNLEIDIALTNLGKDRPWAVSLEKNIQRMITANRLIAVPKSQDLFVFIKLETSTIFTMDISRGTSTISLLSEGFSIPVCHAEAKTVSKISLGYTLKQKDLINPVKIYSTILDITNEFKVIPQPVSNSLNYILYQTSIHSKISKINNQLRILDFGFSFDSSAEVDIFKTLLLMDNYVNINVSSNKLYNYINNLFLSPDYREGYIMSVTDDDKLALKLGDIMNDGSEDAALITEQEFFEEEIEDSDDDVSFASDLDILNDDFDDIDFEGFGEEDELDPNERAFQFLDVSIAETSDEDKTFQSSRTGITINPNSEFPYAIIRRLQLWKTENSLRNIRGITKEGESVSSIPNAFLTSYRLTNTISDNLLHRLTYKTEIELPCSLSDLVTIDKVINS
jgi:hypothetical protein